jgi:hypothetical protein
VVVEPSLEEVIHVSAVVFEVRSGSDCALLDAWEEIYVHVVMLHIFFICVGISY